MLRKAANISSRTVTLSFPFQRLDTIVDCGVRRLAIDRPRTTRFAQHWNYGTKKAGLPMGEMISLTAGDGHTLGAYKVELSARQRAASL